jgi:alpha-beta hydrolase superfamily lysophospholipase
MPIYRTRFKKEIVCEFAKPEQDSHKVIILCTGMPSYPGRRDELLEFIVSQGYWVFLPRYRGTWESDGLFLEKSPEQDILDIIDEVDKGFIEFWGQQKFAINNPEIYIIGSSFGGAAALLASKDARVKKIVALSPVTDWQNESKTEPIDKLEKFTRIAFGNGYRFKEADFEKLKTGEFYNPISKDMKGEKILIFHAEDDDVVLYDGSKKFSDRTGAKLITLKTGGHFSLSGLINPELWSNIKQFIDA